MQTFSTHVFRCFEKLSQPLAAHPLCRRMRARLSWTAPCEQPLTPASLLSCKRPPACLSSRSRQHHDWRQPGSGAAMDIVQCPGRSPSLRCDIRRHYRSCGAACCTIHARLPRAIRARPTDGGGAPENAEWHCMTEFMQQHGKCIFVSSAGWLCMWTSIVCSYDVRTRNVHQQSRLLCCPNGILTSCLLPDIAAPWRLL